MANRRERIGLNQKTDQLVNLFLRLESSIFS